MIYKRPFRVRIYECDSFGHVNNAVYQKYLQQAMLEAAELDMAWFHKHQAIWVMRRMSMQYVRPAFFAEELSVSTWVSEVDKASVSWQYEIVRGTDIILRGNAEWVLVGEATRRPKRIPQAVQAMFTPVDQVALKPTKLPDDSMQGKPYIWSHRVRRYEIDVMRHVNFATYLNWAEEYMFLAIEYSGWPVERMAQHNVMMVQVRHDLEYHHPAHRGDLIVGTSRPVWLGKVRGTWLHELRRADNGKLLFRDYSTGAFLTLEGKPTRLPDAMIQDVGRGGTLP